MTLQEYEQNKRECWEEYLSEHKTTYTRTAFDYAFDRAYSLGKQEKDTGDNRTLKVNRQLFCRLCADADVPKNAESGTHSLNYILKDSFRNERRLNIAAQILSGIVASGKPCRQPVKRALELTDALVAECKKGGVNA